MTIKKEYIAIAGIANIVIVAIVVFIVTMQSSGMVATPRAVAKAPSMATNTPVPITNQAIAYPTPTAYMPEIKEERIPDRISVYDPHSAEGQPVTVYMEAGKKLIRIHDGPTFDCSEIKDSVTFTGNDESLFMSLSDNVRWLLVDACPRL